MNWIDKTSITPARLQALAQQFGTPLWVYDAAVVRQRVKQLHAFDTIRFAQKANSNTLMLRLMRAQGVKVDSVSRGEILRALKAGYTASFNEEDATTGRPELHQPPRGAATAKLERGGAVNSGIVFTADLFDHATLDCVIQHRVPVNAGSIDMLRQLGLRSPGHAVWLRINPGFGHGHSNKTNTGGEHSKHGIWHTELEAALSTVRQHGLQLIGLHMHIGSGVDYDHLSQVCDAMLGLVKRCHAVGHQDHVERWTLRRTDRQRRFPRQ